jgi:hypothetical protein
MTRRATYDAAFYEDLSGASRSAAEIILPFVQDLVLPHSALDVGCGSGEWLHVWDDLGVHDFAGVDGAYVGTSTLSIPESNFHPTDLVSGTVDLGRRFDLVSSFEVAEHLPPQAAVPFVASLTRHADVVLFSASAPGQGGIEHVNEQWPRYWIDLFGSHGFEVLDVIRPHFWDDDRIIYYYRQNMMLFAHPERRSELFSRCELLPTFGGRSIMHPDLYLIYQLVYEREKGARELIKALGPATASAVKRRVKGWTK